MERLKRSFSFRKKKDHVPESHKPHQWQEDERKVRDGTCSFQVRYLGCIEVFESRGIQICEEAVKALKSKNHRSVWSRMSIRRKKNKENQETPPVENIDDQCRGKYQRAILYVSGDALRVVDEISKGLIVDQTIEKVSFCAPDRNQEKGFAYICRDGTTRRWMCHGFLAVKETGERLSHAVGCAFAICLERKQKREKETVTVTFNDKGTSFTRTGSFRQTTLTERLADPQSAIIAEPVPFKPQETPNAVQRPHATVDMLQRQSSFRGFQKLGESSPFKRQLSLRMNELPSTLDRQKNFGNSLTNGTTVPTIPEASPTKENEEESISDMCQQLTQGLNALGSDDPFASAPNSAALVVAQQKHNTGTSNIPNSTNQSSASNNPWGSPQMNVPGASKVSDAEFWLHAATSIAKDTVSTHNTITTGMTATSSVVTTTAVMNGSIQTNPGFNPGFVNPVANQGIVNPGVVNPVANPGIVNPAANPGVINPLAIQQSSPWGSPAPVASHKAHLAYNPAQRAPQLSQVRSHSVDTAEMWKQNQQKTTPTLRELSNKGHVTQFTSQQQQAQWNSLGNNNHTQSTTTTQNTFSVDPFDAAWAAKSGAPVNNPFQAGDAGITKTFEVNL